MLNLFKPFILDLPYSWFTEHHKVIERATTLDELIPVDKAIDYELNRFSLSSSNRIKLIMLSAYCNLRMNLIKRHQRKLLITSK